MILAARVTTDRCLSLFFWASVRGGRFAASAVQREEQILEFMPQSPFPSRVTGVYALCVFLTASVQPPTQHLASGTPTTTSQPQTLMLRHPPHRSVLPSLPHPPNTGRAGLTQVIGVGAVGEDGQEAKDGRELAVGQLRDRGLGSGHGAGLCGGAGAGVGAGSGLTSRTAGMSSSSPKT